ncbi:MAG: hypothetical protein ACTSRG_06400 [Candidatus Helarchaeota archaeon]
MKKIIKCDISDECQYILSKNIEICNNCRDRLNYVIMAKLNKQKAWYNTSENDWNLIMPHREIKTSKRTIRVKFSKTKGTKSIVLSHPFQISKLTAYMYGLILGSAIKKKDCLILRTDIRNLLKVNSFCRQFQITPKIIEILKRYKKRGKNTCGRYFKEVVIYFPPPIHHYMKALGLNLFRPKIPSYFAPILKHLVIQGYLNSKSTKLVHHSTKPLIQWIEIKASSESIRVDYAKNFILQINEALRDHSIITELKIEQYNSKITVKNGNIANILKAYHIRRPQIRYSGKFIDLMKKYPHIRKTVNRYNLNSFQLTILEIAFYYFYKRNSDEVEYSRFDEILCTSSNAIRKVLYDFQNWGIIQYFAKGKKEFIRPTYLCFKYTEEKLKRKIDELKRYTNQDTEIKFLCPNCGASVTYAEAILGKSFSCPHCNSFHLENYSNDKLERSLNNYKGQLNQFRISLEMMCYAGCS